MLNKIIEMKKLLLILLVVFTLNTNAQYLTSFAKNINTAETDGFYYHLPRNIIKVDFTIEKTQNIKGKYHHYAKEMLNTDNYINENKTTYAIKSINIATFTEADPNMVFYIMPVSDEKSKESVNINLELSPEGIIESFGYNVNSSESVDNIIIEKELPCNEQITDYYYIPTQDEDDEDDEDDSNNKLTEHEIALTVVEEIKKLREAYFDLITGFQEVNYGTTINCMVEQIKELENEYLVMFVGKTITSTYTQSFYIIPEEGKNTITLAKFSETEGFNNKAGETVKINFTDLSVSSNIKMTKDDIEKIAYANRLFYRNPANVTMQINLGDKIISENRLKISQLGDVSLISMSKMKLTFDPNTGQILSIIKE